MESALVMLNNGIATGNDQISESRQIIELD